jgi:hypothetical protein
MSFCNNDKLWLQLFLGGDMKEKCAKSTKKDSCDRLSSVPLKIFLEMKGWNPEWILDDSSDKTTIFL